MVNNQGNLPDFLKYRDAFTALESISYKDIYFNGIHLKPLGIHLMEHGEGWSINTHRHSFFEAHYIVDGTTTTVLNNKEYNITGGKFYIMPPGTLHSHIQYKGSAHIGFALRWELKQDTSIPQVGIRYTKEITELLLQVNAVPMEDKGEVFDGMLDMLRASVRGAGVLELQVVFTRLLLNMAHSCISFRKPEETKANRNFLYSNIVNSAVKFIEENYNGHIDVKDVANSVHLSYSHLSRLFRIFMGETVNIYINKTRIRRAQYLLNCSDCDVETIAYESGFQSSIYFCSIFRKLVGMSPKQYRKLYGRLME